MEFKDYYKILEVNESAGKDDIKKAYKRLARKYHPDVSKEDDAEARFKEVAEAYEVLKDPARREEYDQLRAMGGRSRSGQFTPPPGWESATHYYDGDTHGDFSDFFESMFGRNGRFHRGAGGGQPFNMRGEDVQAELALLLEEAYKGSEQTVQIRVPDVDERGLISHRNRTLKVKIPAGTADGTVLRLKGQGGKGLGQGPDGDLLVRVRLAEHPLYSVDGKHLSLVVPVLPWEAALGTRVEIPTPAGRTRVTIPAGSQTGNRLRLSGQGLPGKPPGDFYVVLKVVMPDRVSDKAAELYRGLQALETVNPRASLEART